MRSLPSMKALGEAVFVRSIRFCKLLISCCPLTSDLWNTLSYITCPGNAQLVVYTKIMQVWTLVYLCHFRTFRVSQYKQNETARMYFSQFLNLLRGNWMYLLLHWKTNWAPSFPRCFTGLNSSTYTTLHLRLSQFCVCSDRCNHCAVNGLSLAIIKPSRALHNIVLWNSLTDPLSKWLLKSQLYLWELTTHISCPGSSQPQLPCTERLHFILYSLHHRCTTYSWFLYCRT